MPLGATTRRSLATVLPPLPPSTAAPRRIRLQIVGHLRSQQTRGYRLGAFSLALLLLAPLAYAQPAQWESYSLGSTTYYSGTDAKGGHWTGRSFLLWGERYYEFTGPDGQAQHCRAYAQPGAKHTECFP